MIGLALGTGFFRRELFILIRLKITSDATRVHVRLTEALWGGKSGTTIEPFRLTRLRAAGFVNPRRRLARLKMMATTAVDAGSMVPVLGYSRLRRAAYFGASTAKGIHRQSKNRHRPAPGRGQLSPGSFTRDGSGAVDVVQHEQSLLHSKAQPRSPQSGRCCCSSPQ